MKTDSDYFPMRELERRSGFPRATILFYIKEGLLPQPRKTAKNMAVYDRRFVDGLHLIQELKEKHKLSLPQIKDVLQRSTGGVGLELLLDVRDRAFSQLTNQREQELLTWDELVAKTNLAPDELRYLDEQRFLITQPGQEIARYHPDNVIAGRLLRQLMAMGFPLESFALISKQLGRLADTEVKALMDHTSSPMVQQGTPAQTIIDTAQTGFDLLQSLVALLHPHHLYHVLHSTNWPEYFAGDNESDTEDED
jgi:DNA-binding transcriptional MerR regulator